MSFFFLILRQYTNKFLEGNATYILLIDVEIDATQNKKQT